MSDLPVPLPLDVDQIKGFLDPGEGAALQRAALAGSRLGGCLEIGAYCGKSAIYIGAACQSRGAVLFSVDHHRGSEENQPGWTYHDPELWDHQAAAMDTLPHLRRNLRAAGLEETVIPIVGRSAQVAAHWGGRLGFLFIDGGHTMEAALGDYRGWTPHLAAGGLLAIHDVFPDPADGGRPPFEIYQRALVSDLFIEVESVKSLRVLRRL
ncbi:class I SAM-dependent methyltransferase [Phenylobacterium sp.]|uniref:class I SAM-dependent methyltransferase n=1 Tax=Phenylobacterium sp. TaxID=1871053 RepID=UPI002731C91E|nr:class I SAM-dependent methyltransferase [Phenylobacterium sp.]MDP2213501.1 class I SAM-dependent methyltransferase [Phenylobacterium sp.]